MAENAEESPKIMSPDIITTRCQNYFKRLIRLADEEKKPTIVKRLIHNLINGVIEPEEFSTQLEKALQSSHLPNLIPYLKKSLPHVRLDLFDEMSKEVIRPPPAQSLATQRKSKVDLEPLKPSFGSEIAQIIPLREFQMDATFLKELRDKVDSLVEENSSNSQEKVKLLRDLLVCIRIEKQRQSARRIVILNRRRGQLKKVWESRGLRVEKNTLQTASSKDAFDMSSLIESLPSKPGDSDTRKIAEKLAKEYLLFFEEKKRSFRRSEIYRILAANASEQSNESSSKPCHSKSLTRMVSKVCGDVKNARIFSFRPLIKKCSDCGTSKTDSCPEFQKKHEFQKEEKDKRTLDFDGESSLQNGPLPSEKVTYKMGPEMLVLLKSPCANTDEKRSNVLKDDVNTANNRGYPELHLFNKDQREDEQQRIVSRQKQQMHDSLSLSRQLSRLKITNSRRGEDMEESEIHEAFVDEIKNEEEKGTIAKSRRELLLRLREKYTQHTLKKETEALNKN